MRIRLAALGSIVCFVPSIAYAQPQEPASSASTELPTPVSRFRGDGRFKSGGRMRDAQITIRQWTIPARQKVDALPERGFLLVTVRAGKVTTTINGRQQQRHTDDFWTVPENTKMSVEARGEAALLEVLSLTVR